MVAKKLESQTPTRGAPVPWWRPEGAQLIKERTGQRTTEWVVVSFPLGRRRELYDIDRLWPRFLALADARRRQGIAFARRYGIPVDPRKAWRQFREKPGDAWGMELSSLRRYAALLDAALRLYRRIEARKLPFSKDPAVGTVRGFLRDHGLDADRWREVRHPYAEHDVARVGPGELEKWWALQRDRVVGVANWWLERGKVHPQAVVLPNGRLAVRWTGGLWGALGGQLLYALRREANVAICDYCDQEFRLSRRPREGAETRCCPRRSCQRRYRADRMRRARALKASR